MNSQSQITMVRILVAESDPDQMDYIAGILEGAGYYVHKAYIVGDAIFALEHSEFALAVIDTHMKDHDQRTLTDYMVQQHAVRWIALSRRGDPVPEHLLAQGAAACIQSPFTSLTLLRHVEQALNGVSPVRVGAAASPDRPSVEGENVDVTGISHILKRQLIEQQTLSRLARSLSAVLDLDVLLTQVVDAAVRLCNAEEGLLLLPDEEEEALYIRAVKGLDSETARNFRIKTQDTVAGQVYHSGQPVLMDARGPHKLTTQHLVRSLLYVPLSIKGETIGVLGVNNRHTDRAFTAHDRELLQDLAAHAAVAIENARLYEESVLRTRELSTLVHAAEATNSTLALDRVLSIIASQLIGALDMSQCYITEWYPEQEALRPLAIRYRVLWKPTAGPVRVPQDDPAVAQLLATRQPVLTAPEPPGEGHLPGVWLPHHYHAHNVLHMPLYAQDRLLGIATFYRMHAPYPEAVVPQVATTLLHRQVLQMVVLLVGAEATRRRDNLFQIAQQILEMAEADWVDIALWNTAQRQFDVTLSYGEMIWQGPTGPHLDVRQFPQLGAMLHGSGALTDQDRDELAQLNALGFGRSLLTLPLEIKGDVAGLVFLVDTLQERQFSRREVELAQALVSQAANALDNARLYRDLELSLDELNRTQSKLVQTARLSAMGELAAAVAHQINNPLTTILGDAEMMQQDLDPNDPAYESVTAILRAGKRAHAVVRRLLGMARQQPGAEVRIPLDVTATVENTLMLVRGHIQQGGVTVHVELAEDLPPVRGMQGELEDVWLNLLLNARDAVAEHPNPQIGIRTGLTDEGAQIEVVVWDNGPGIPLSQRAQIFEPFFTTKPPGEGTGLGLHICKQIVLKCNGSINLQSTYNQGTQFIVHLPVYTKRESDL